MKSGQQEIRIERRSVKIVGKLNVFYVCSNDTYEPYFFVHDLQKALGIKSMKNVKIEGKKARRDLNAHVLRTFGRKGVGWKLQQNSPTIDLASLKLIIERQRSHNVDWATIENSIHNAHTNNVVVEEEEEEKSATEKATAAKRKRPANMPSEALSYYVLSEERAEMEQKVLQDLREANAANEKLRDNKRKQLQRLKMDLDAVLVSSFENNPKGIARHVLRDTDSKLFAEASKLIIDRLSRRIDVKQAALVRAAQKRGATDIDAMVE